MRRVVLAALVGLAAAPAMAQVSAPPAGQPSAKPTEPTMAPRNPSAAAAGLTATSPAHTDRTVGAIDRKLLFEEKDRPHLPGQAPSPSQGGTGTGAGPVTANPPRQ